MEGEYNIMTLFDLCSRPCFVEEESVVVLGLNKCYIPWLRKSNELSREFNN